MDRVEQFIHNFKKGFNETELVRIFTEGGCYHFAVILDHLFEGEIVHHNIINHFMLRVRDSAWGEELSYTYYDITGVVDIIDEHNIQTWDDIKNNHPCAALYLSRDCIKLESR